MLQFRSRSSGLTAVIVLFVWCGTWTWIIGSDVCILPYFILFFLFITYMSVVCLLSSHANCDILYVYLYAVSVYLCLLACCVFIGLAAWNKMDDDSGHFGPPLPFWAPAPPRHCRGCRWLVTPLDQRRTSGVYRHLSRRWSSVRPSVCPSIPPQSFVALANN